MNLANDASADPLREQTWKLGWLLHHSSLPCRLHLFLLCIWFCCFFNTFLDWRPIEFLGPAWQIAALHYLICQTRSLSRVARTHCYKPTSVVPNFSSSVQFPTTTSAIAKLDRLATWRGANAKELRRRAMIKT